MVKLTWIKEVNRVLWVFIMFISACNSSNIEHHDSFKSFVVEEKCKRPHAKLKYYSMKGVVRVIQCYSLLIRVQNSNLPLHHLVLFLDWMKISRNLLVLFLFRVKSKAKNCLKIPASTFIRFLTHLVFNLWCVLWRKGSCKSGIDKVFDPTNGRFVRKLIRLYIWKIIVATIWMI